MSTDGLEIFKSIVEGAAADSSAHVKYEMAPPPVPSLKMVNHYHPWSITPGEFDFIRQYIRTNSLTRGYECATAFGISALAAALGFSETGGKLVTLDAYIEEKYNDCFRYRELKEVNESDPDGLRSIKWLAEKFNTESQIIPVVGWSPDDVAKAIVLGHGSEVKLDYIFIDAGHWDDAAMQDVASVRPFVDTSKPFAIFFLDLPCFTDKLWNLCKILYAQPMRPIGSVVGGTWGMGVISNIP